MRLASSCTGLSLHHGHWPVARPSPAALCRAQGAQGLALQGCLSTTGKRAKALNHNMGSPSVEQTGGLLQIGTCDSACSTNTQLWMLPCENGPPTPVDTCMGDFGKAEPCGSKSLPSAMLTWKCNTFTKFFCTVPHRMAAAKGTVTSP